MIDTTKLEECMHHLATATAILKTLSQSPAPAIGALSREWRDRAMPLAKQAKNPGAMNYGPRARRFQSIAWYEGTPGNKTAIFPTVQDGVNALVDRILRDEGYTIKDYLIGGDKIEPADSYGGGQDYSYYMKAFTSGSTILLNPDGIITDAPQTVWAMVNAHAKAEGADMTISLPQVVSALVERKGT